MQGLAGAAGLVIARAVVRDLYAGRDLVVFFSRLILISGLAPVIAPVLGGQLSKIMTWRGMFLVLAGFGAVLLLAGLFGVPETTATGPPNQRRVLGHPARFLGADSGPDLPRAVLCRRPERRLHVRHIAGATFVLQRSYGLSAVMFSLVFATNSLGIIACGQIGARLSRSWPPSACWP